MYLSIRVFNSLPSGILKLQYDKLLFKYALKEYLSSHALYCLDKFFELTMMTVIYIKSLRKSSPV
jgi:hypothetical protein